MNTNTPQRGEKGPHRYFFNGYFLGFLVIAGYFLLTEHRAHVVPYLPFLLLLACPLMHLFMHRGHGHHSRAHGERGEQGGCCGHQHSEHDSTAHEQRAAATPDDQVNRSDKPM